MEQLLTSLRVKVTWLFGLHFISYSAGLAAVILLLLFVQHELAFDSDHADKDRIYRAHVDYKSFGFDTLMPIRDLAVAQSLENDADIEAIFALIPAEFIGYVGHQFSLRVTNSNNDFNLQEVYFASSNLTEFINIEVLLGDLDSALNTPNKLAISESEALRLFANINVIGRRLITTEQTYTISAVFKDLPKQTHLQFKVLTAIPKSINTPPHGYIYIKTAANTNIASLEQKLFDAYLQTKSAEHKTVKYKLINIGDIYLYGNSVYEMKPSGSITAVTIASTLIFIILLQISCNFINVNLVNVGRAAKQIAIRKAIGASRRQLFNFVIIESILITSFAVLLSLVFVELSYDYFNLLVETDISFKLTQKVVLLAILASLIIGLLNGAYAAIIVAKTDVKLLMRTHYQYHLKGLVKTILCFQTGLAIVVFMVFLITRAQLNFVANMELGYQIDNRLIVKDLPAQALFDQPQSALLSAIGELPGVVSVTATSINLTQQVRGELSFTWPNGEKIQGIAPSVVTHFNAIDALGLNLLAGRDFSEQQQSDWYQKSADGSEKIALIVTESMVRLAGYDSAQEVIGMTVTNSNEELTGKIIGVVSDVKIGSAKHKMTPLSFNLARNKLTTANIIINIAKTTAPTPLKNEVLRLLESRFSLLDIEVKSLKDDYAKHYKNEQQVITLSRYLFILSSALTIISLAVLVSQTIHVQQRTLAIKKVLGSSVAHLINELSFGYLKLVSISLIASMPLVYWLMNEWLNNFNDRISQPLWLYFLVAFAVVTITWLIIAMLAYKAAITRPSLILRDE